MGIEYACKATATEKRLISNGSNTLSGIVTLLRLEQYSKVDALMD